MQVMDRTTQIPLLPATLTLALLLTSCGKSKWYFDFDEAKDFARRRDKDIFLLFSSDGCEQFKQDVLSSEQFEKRFLRLFVFADVDFSTKQDTPESGEVVQEQASLKAKNERLLRYYDVQRFPCAFVLSSEGYVLSEVTSDKASEADAEKYSAKVDEARQRAAKLKVPLEKVKNYDGVEKAQAIDELFKATEGKYAYLLKELVWEVPQLDGKNETGLLGEYEIQGAYFSSLDAFEAGEDPAAPFVDASKKNSLSKAQKQEALYMAAFALVNNVNNEDVDYERVLELLTAAYEMDSRGEFSESIFEVFQSMQNFAYKKRQQEAD